MGPREPGGAIPSTHPTSVRLDFRTTEEGFTNEAPEDVRLRPRAPTEAKAGAAFVLLHESQAGEHVVPMRDGDAPQGGAHERAGRARAHLEEEDEATGLAAGTRALQPTEAIAIANNRDDVRVWIYGF